MEQREVMIYILLGIAVTNLIRMLPMALIKGPIKNRFVRSFLVLCALRDAGSDDVSRHGADCSYAADGHRGAGGGYHSGMVETGTAAGCCGLQCDYVFDDYIGIKELRS